jgi:hypothetical protein
MGHPDTLWLTVMNATLGLAVLAFCLIVGLGAACEWALGRRRGGANRSRQAGPRSGW